MKLAKCMKIAAAAVVCTLPYSAQARLLDGTFSPDYNADVFVNVGRFQWDPTLNVVGGFVNVESATVPAGFTLNQVTDDINDNGVLDGTYVGGAASKAAIAGVFNNAGSVNGIADEFFYLAGAGQLDPGFIRRGYVSTTDGTPGPGSVSRNDFNILNQVTQKWTNFAESINPKLNADNTIVLNDDSYDVFTATADHVLGGQSALMTWNGVGTTSLLEKTLGNFFVGTDGSISLTAVPVPAAVWLFGSGIVGLVGVARRRKA